MRVPVTALLLEIGELARSGQLSKWRDEILQSVQTLATDTMG